MDGVMKFSNKNLNEVMGFMVWLSTRGVTVEAPLGAGLDPKAVPDDIGDVRKVRKLIRKITPKNSEKYR